MVGLAILLMLFIVAIFAPIIAPYHYDEQNYQIANQYPSFAHPFGTDNLGRDILSRLIYGSRVSLQIGFIAVGIGAVVGGLLGAFAAFYGKAVDNILSAAWILCWPFPVPCWPSPSPRLWALASPML